MSEQEIIKILSGWLDTRKYPFQMANAFFYGWECDYWALDNGGIAREFEIKISRSDFLGDSKKHKHENPENGANYFYYVTPENLVKADEIPRPYGLIWVCHGGLLSIVKKPRQLHTGKFCRWRDLARKSYFRYREVMLEKLGAKEITRQEYRDSLLLEWAEDSEQDSITTQKH